MVLSDNRGKGLAVLLACLIETQETNAAQGGRRETLLGDAASLFPIGVSRAAVQKDEDGSSKWRTSIAESTMSVRSGSRQGGREGRLEIEAVNRERRWNYT